VALPLTSEAVASACWVVRHVGGDVEACMDGRGSVHLDRAIPPALEPVGGSALSTHDLFI
jgi:hypothetical protein